MKPRHTPGPWSLGHLRKQRVDSRLGVMYEQPVHVGDSSNSGNCLAIVYGGGPGGIYSDAESVIANAALIAEAPALLDALKEVTRCLGWHAQQHPVGMDCKAVARARRIIARADPAPRSSGWVIEAMNAAGQWSWEFANPKLSLEEAVFATRAEAEAALATAARWCDAPCRISIAPTIEQESEA